MSKDDKKVYIRGNKYRGDAIIKTLTDKGALNVLKYDGTGESYVYYINDDNRIAMMLMSKVENLKKNGYKELKSCLFYKQFDILINKSKIEFQVFIAKDDDNIPDGFYSCLCVSDKSLKNMPLLVSGLSTDYRLADPDEIDMFHELLHQYHTEWNENKKELVPWRWTPNDGDTYYYIKVSRSRMHVCSAKFNYNDRKAVTTYKNKNCFQTYDEAKFILERILTIFDKQFDSYTFEQFY